MFWRHARLGPFGSSCSQVHAPGSIKHMPSKQTQHTPSKQMIKIDFPPSTKQFLIGWTENYYSMALPKSWKTKSSEVIWKFYSIALTKSNISNNAIQLYVQKYMSRRSNSSGIKNSSAPAPHPTVRWILLWRLISHLKALRTLKFAIIF